MDNQTLTDQFKINQAPVYNKRGDKHQFYLSQIGVRLEELRTNITAPDVTGEEKSRTIKAIVRLETERANAIDAYNVATGQAPKHELDGRDKAVKEAERLEATGIEANIKIARGIRQGIIDHEFKESQKDSSHRQHLADGIHTRQETIAERERQEAEQQAEIAAELDMQARR